MSELDDHQLLAEFTQANSESAFAAIVTRHVGLVYSVALRGTGNAHAAEEIVQAVFLILAKKARGLSTKTILSGWLYQTTRLTTANHIRSEIRRQNREQEAYMQSLLNENQTDTTGAWRQIAPLLDGALDQLGAHDRDALVLRFFENKSLAEVGAALGASEDAAKMRVNRALEKLRKFFSKRGLTLTTAIIAGAVSANSVQAAPAGLAALATTTAHATIASATLTTIVKGTMKTMTWMKFKFAAVAGVAGLLVIGATTVAISETNRDDKSTVLEITKQTQAAYAALASYSDTCTGSASGSGSVTETTCTIRLQRPKQIRVEWASTGGTYPAKGIIWSDGGAYYEVMDSADHFASAKAQTARDMQMAFAFANGVSGGAASTVPCVFFKLNYGDLLAAVASGRTETKRTADEKIGDVDCFVIVSILDSAKLFANSKMPKNTAVDIRGLGTSTTTFWIGRQDHLIHQVKATTSGMVLNMKFTDEALASQLEHQNKPVTPENLAALRAELEKSMALAQNSGFTFTERHEHIVVDQTFVPSDFAR